LASMYPSAPGIRTYLKVALDSRVSLLLVYLYLFFMVLVAGMESYLFALVVKAIVPQVSAMGTVLVLLALTVAINLLGVELPKGIQIVVTLVLIVTVVVTALYGISSNPGGASFRLTLPLDRQSLLYLPAAAGIAIYLFVGFEWVTMLGMSPKAYEWKIPFSMPLAIITNVITYSIFVIALAMRLPPATVTGTPIPQVPFFQLLFSSRGSYVALFLSALAIMSTFNAGVMGGSRLIYALSREGNMPRWCARMSLRTGAPLGGTWLLGGLATIASVLIVHYRLEALAAIVGSSIVCFVYAAFMLAVIRLRKSQPAARRSFRTPVPVWIQWLIIGILPLLGVVSLFSEPDKIFQAVGVTLAVVASCWVLVQWVLARNKARLALQTQDAAAD
jgi:amino acid transporter